MTIEQLRQEIRDLADIPEWMWGRSGFKTSEKEQIAEELDPDRYWSGSGPMLNNEIRDHLGLLEDGERDGSDLRKDDLEALRDELAGE